MVACYNQTTTVMSVGDSCVLTNAFGRKSVRIRFPAGGAVHGSPWTATTKHLAGCFPSLRAVLVFSGDRLLLPTVTLLFRRNTGVMQQHPTKFSALDSFPAVPLFLPATCTCGYFLLVRDQIRKPSYPGNVVPRVAVPEHPTVCRLESRFRNYVCFRTTAQKSDIPLFVSCFAGFISPWVTSHFFASVALSVRGWVSAWPGLVDGVRLLIRDDMLFGYPLSFLLTPHFPSQLQHDSRVGCERMGYWRISALHWMGVLLEDRCLLRCFARGGLDAQSMEELVLIDVFSGQFLETLYGGRVLKTLPPAACSSIHEHPQTKNPNRRLLPHPVDLRPYSVSDEPLDAVLPRCRPPTHGRKSRRVTQFSLATTSLAHPGSFRYRTVLHAIHPFLASPSSLSNIYDHSKQPPKFRQLCLQLAAFPASATLTALFPVTSPSFGLSDSSGDRPATGHRGHGGRGRWGYMTNLVLDLMHTYFIVCLSIILAFVICFRFCFRVFSGEIKPPPPPKSMVAGGGGFKVRCMNISGGYVLVENRHSQQSLVSEPWFERISYENAMMACSVFIKGVGVGHSGKDNLDQLGVRSSIKGDVVRQSPSFRIHGQIRKYLQQSEGGLSSYVADTGRGLGQFLKTLYGGRDLKTLPPAACSSIHEHPQTENPNRRLLPHPVDLRPYSVSDEPLDAVLPRCRPPTHGRKSRRVTQFSLATTSLAHPGSFCYRTVLHTIHPFLASPSSLSNIHDHSKQPPKFRQLCLQLAAFPASATLTALFPVTSPSFGKSSISFASFPRAELRKTSGQPCAFLLV
ncbi:hypothetical protein LXL04_020057 [Taraxacum kok-saghyz]